MELRYTWDYFFTITLKPAHHADSWNKQRKYFERFIDSIQHHKVTAVLELQRNGAYHIHGIVSFLYNPYSKTNIDFRKYFQKMKNKIKEFGTMKCCDFEVCDNFSKCSLYCFKDVHKGFIVNPVLINDYEI